MRVWIGIDPGVTGAVAAIFENENVLIFDAPTAQVKSGKRTRTEFLPHEMAAMLKGFIGDDLQPQVVIEKVSAMPGQGVTSMFNFGTGWGMWIGICAALDLPYRFVTPNEWKKEMMSGMGKDKDASVVQAQRLFPDAAHLLQRPKRGGGVMLLNGRADSLLIAAWGRKQG